MNLIPLKALAGKMRKKGRAELIAAAVITVSIVLIFASTYFGDRAKNTDMQDTERISINEGELSALEERIAGTLSEIKGAGRVRVMVTYDTGREIVPVYGTDKEVSTVKDGGSGNRVSEQVNEKSSPVLLTKNGENSALVFKEIEPEIRGVIVIAQGAKDMGVQIKLRQAVTTVLNISAEKVDVFEMN